MVPSQEQRDFVAALDALLTRADPLTALPGEPGDRRFDGQLWRTLADMGALGLLGADRDPFTATLVSECLGRHVAPLPYLSSAVLAATFRAALGAGDTGARVTTVGFLGADGLLTGATDVVATGGRLSGRLPFVPDADIAEEVLTLARVGDRVVPFAVPVTAGQVRPLVTLDQTQPVATVTFDGAAGEPLPEDRLAGALAATRAAGIAALTANLVGTAEKLLTTSVEYAGQRVQFGRSIGGRQAIKHRCADMLILVESARSAAYHLATVLDDDPRTVALAASTAKAYCSAAAVSCASSALQIHGGIGFTWEHPLHRYFKRCVVGAQLLGDVRHHHNAILDLLAAG